MVLRLCVRLSWRSTKIIKTNLILSKRIENGIVYTVEGNTSDSCAERYYAVGHSEILGYGMPAY